MARGYSPVPDTNGVPDGAAAAAFSAAPAGPIAIQLRPSTSALSSPTIRSLIVLLVAIAGVLPGKTQGVPTDARQGKRLPKSADANTPKINHWLGKPEKQFQLWTIGARS